MCCVHLQHNDHIVSSMVVYILGELSDDTIVLTFQRNSRSELTFELPSLPLFHYSVSQSCFLYNLSSCSKQAFSSAASGCDDELVPGLSQTRGPEHEAILLLMNVNNYSTDTELKLYSGHLETAGKDFEFGK